MDQFLDTGIIVGYAQDEKKFVLYVKNKKEEFIVCYFVLEKDIPSLTKRMRIIINQVKNKIQNKDYKIDKRDLYPQDITRIDKFLALKEVNKLTDIEFINFLDNFQRIFEFRIDFFIQKLIGKKIVQVRDIDFNLKSSLFTYTQNHSDANILASSIQYHQENEIILVTADRQDWTKDNLEWALPEHSDLRKKYPKIPEIKYV